MEARIAQVGGRGAAVLKSSGSSLRRRTGCSKGTAVTSGRWLIRKGLQVGDASLAEAKI